MANLLLRTQPWMLDELIRQVEKVEDEEEEDDERQNIAQWVRGQNDFDGVEEDVVQDRTIILSDSKHHVDATVKKEAIEEFYRQKPEYNNRFDRLRGTLLRLDKYRFVKNDAGEYELVINKFSFVCAEGFGVIGSPEDINEAWIKRIKLNEEKKKPDNPPENIQDESSSKSEESCFGMRGLVQDDGSITAQGISSNEDLPVSPPRDRQQSQDAVSSASNIIQSGLEIDDRKSIQSNEMQVLLDAINADRVNVESIFHSSTELGEKPRDDVTSPVLLYSSGSSRDDFEDPDEIMAEAAQELIAVATNTPMKQKTAEQKKNNQEKMPFDLREFEMIQTQQNSWVNTTGEEMLALLESDSDQHKTKSTNESSVITSPPPSVRKNDHQLSSKVKEKQPVNTCSIDIQSWNNVLQMWKKRTDQNYQF